MGDGRLWLLGICDGCRIGETDPGRLNRFVTSRGSSADCKCDYAVGMSDGWSAEIEAAWVAEAKRRAEEIDRGELELVDSVEMMARLRERAAIKRERSARLGADPSVPRAELSPETALERDDTGDELDDHERAALDAAISPPGAGSKGGDQTGGAGPRAAS